MRNLTTAQPAPAFQQTPQEPDQHDFFMREEEVARISGVSRVTRWRWEREGLFPKRRQIGPNTVGWLASEILAWRNARATSGVAA